jgi:hypothetical protein
LRVVLVAAEAAAEVVVLEVIAQAQEPQVAVRLLKPL